MMIKRHYFASAEARTKRNAVVVCQGCLTACSTSLFPIPDQALSEMIKALEEYFSKIGHSDINVCVTAFNRC